MTDWKVVSPWRSDLEPASGDEWPPVDDRRPRLDESEAAKVVTVLESGSIVLRRTKRMADPLSDSDALVVPLSISTDGQWIWPDALTYFVKTHRISPEDDFMRYLRSRNFEPRRPSEAEVKAAWEAIRED